MKFLENIFSITRDKKFNRRKILTFCGLHIPLDSKFDKIYAKRFHGLNQSELEFCVKTQFKKWHGYKPNLNTPKTFNEKLTWIKLYYHNPLMTICADKVTSRDYFCKHIKDGKKHLVKQFGVYKTPEEIDFAKLPDSFVLKSNWGSGQQIIVKNKKDLDIDSAIKQMHQWIKPESNHYFYAFEHGYKNIKPRIICEEFLDFEYKLEIFCFNGQPRFFWIVMNDKTDKVQANFYELNWKLMPVSNHYPNFATKLKRPKCYDEILDNAKKMCGNFPFVRCDFYITKDDFRFSEMTFFHWAAAQDFDPKEYDIKFGDMMVLPKTKTNVAEV